MAGRAGGVVEDTQGEGATVKVKHYLHSSKLTEGNVWIKMVV